MDIRFNEQCFVSEFFQNYKHELFMGLGIKDIAN